jgi:Flp pilus assembly pilin Flp
MPWEAAGAALCRLRAERRAVAPLEYALIASMVAVVLAIALTGIDFDFSKAKAALAGVTAGVTAAFTP